MWCRGISLPSQNAGEQFSLSSRTGEHTHMGVGELVYPLALESN